MWEISTHNNYARLTGRLRVVTALLIRMGGEAGFHFSEFIRFLGNRIGGASGNRQVSTNTTIDRGPLATARDIDPAESVLPAVASGSG
jgi:hypothetical protein